MHAKSGLRVFLEWKIYRPDSVIAAVISLYRMESRMQVNWSEIKIQFSVRTLVFATVFVALLISTSPLAAPHIRSLFLNLSHKPGPFRRGG